MHWMLMPLKRYAEFSGRSRRMEFWMWQLFKFLVSCVIWILIIALFGAAFMNFAATKDPAQLVALGGGFILVWLICMVFGLAILIPDIAVAVRRLHDTNRSGWWYLAPFGAVVVGWIAMVMSIGAGAAMGKDGGLTGMGIGGIIFLVAMLAAGVLGITLIVFYFLEGTPGPNKYGPDPKGLESGEVFN